MPRAYSLDLRARVIAACEAEEYTRAEIAHQFEVAEATLYDWLQRWRTDRELTPRPQRRGRISGLDWSVLAALVEKQNDRTLAEYARAYEERIEETSCRLLFLPRYSPEYNPIEPCWSKLKNELRGRAARTLESLQEAVAEAMQTITAQNARGWFAHCGYRPAPDL